MTDPIKRRYVVFVLDRGYLQNTRRMRRLGDVETARTYPDRETAERALLTYMRNWGKDGTVAETLELIG